MPSGRMRPIPPRSAQRWSPRRSRSAGPSPANARPQPRGSMGFARTRRRSGKSVTRSRARLIRRRRLPPGVPPAPRTGPARRSTSCATSGPLRRVPRQRSRPRWSRPACSTRGSSRMARSSTRGPRTSSFVGLRGRSGGVRSPTSSCRSLREASSRTGSGRSSRASGSRPRARRRTGASGSRRTGAGGSARSTERGRRPHPHTWVRRPASARGHDGSRISRLAYARSARRPWRSSGRSRPQRSGSTSSRASSGPSRAARRSRRPGRGWASARRRTPTPTRSTPSPSGPRRKRRRRGR